MPDANTDGSPREQLFTGYTGRLSMLAAGGWLAITLGRDALPALLPTIVAELGISPSQAGLALSGMFAVYAVAHQPGGRLADRLSIRTVLVASLAISFVGFGLLTVLPGYAGFLVALLFVGVGAGAYLPATRGLLSDLFVERRGQAFGVQISAGTLGSSVGAGLAAAALAVATWQAAFVPPMLALLVVAAGFHYWSREPYVVERVSLGLRRTGGRLFNLGDMRWLVVAYSLFAICWVGVLGFMPTFLQAEKGLSPALASAGFAGFYLTGTVVTPTAGRVSDWLRPTPVAVAALGVAAVGLVGLLASPTLPFVALAIVVYAAGTWSFPPVMQSYLLGVLPAESRAGDFGAIKSVYTLVGSVGPAYVGFVAERSSYAVAFAGFVPLLVVALAILGWLLRGDRF